MRTLSALKRDRIDSSAVSTHFLRAAALPPALFLLVGCASIEPALKPSAPPDAAAAYVAGKFSRIKSGGFAFGLVDVSSGAEYSISLGEDTFLPTDVTDQVLAIKVPPGQYALRHWFTYGTITKERSKKHPITSSVVSAPFSVSAGSVVFLGSFAARSDYSGPQWVWTINQREISSSGAERDFREAYPLLRSLNFSCHLCR